MTQPLIGIICCHKTLANYGIQEAHDSYINAIVEAGGIPILLPQQLNHCAQRDQLFAQLDGILLTGSASNVSPFHYHATHAEPHCDLGRDTLSFHLLAYARDHDLPLLAICRGHQEMNVFFGGTLMPDWRKKEQYYLPHLENETDPLAVQYQEVHDICIHRGGILADFGTTAMVNSLHQQAIDKLAPALFLEASASDGMMEAISLPEHRFMLGVQWHPEFNSGVRLLSRYIFERFFAAIQNR